MVIKIENIIVTKSLSKTYSGGQNGVQALRGVDLEVARGEFLAIVGRSGSGKSTLMNILGCLDTPTGGEYYLNGEKVSSFSEKKLCDIRSRQIGFVFQGFNLIRSLTALENVELPLIYRGLRPSERRKTAKSALESVGLGDRTGHLPGELSGGQQQRVAIARAIAIAPPIILADEPTGNLDSAAADDIMSIFLRLGADGRTIVLITHDDRIAARAGRTVRISDGKIDYEQD